MFKLSNNRCIKIYANEKDRIRESKVLQLAKNTKMVPTVYEEGSNFIVMEYFKGISLYDYLLSAKSFPYPIAKQLVSIFQGMKGLGFRRIDVKLRHIIITENDTLKVIDHVNSLRIKKKWPKSFFFALYKMELLDSFFLSLEKIDRTLYIEWKTNWENTISQKRYKRKPKFGT